MLITFSTNKTVNEATATSHSIEARGELKCSRFIEGMPQDVLAIEATGQVTHEDYRNTLIPKAEAMMAKGPIKILYVVGKEFTGFDLEAMWDDGAFGLKHWHDFSHIAMVSDHVWMRAMRQHVHTILSRRSAAVRSFPIADREGLDRGRKVVRHMTAAATAIVNAAVASMSTYGGRSVRLPVRKERAPSSVTRDR